MLDLLVTSLAKLNRCDRGRDNQRRSPQELKRGNGTDILSQLCKDSLITKLNCSDSLGDNQRRTRRSSKGVAYANGTDILSQLCKDSLITKVRLRCPWIERLWKGGDNGKGRRGGN